MTITDDIVKGLRNPTPLYAVAGTADLAAQKLREVPGLIGRLREEAPGHLEKIKGTDPKAVQEKVAAGAKDAQARLTETYREFDFKAFREKTDFKKLGESVQDLALQGVGRATGYAVRARETYDVLAERGKGAVANWRGEGDGEDAEPAKGAQVREINSAESKPKPTPARRSPARKPAAKAAEPKTAEPKAAEPKSAEPKSAEPKAEQSKAAPSKGTGSGSGKDAR